jgi:oligopeptide/dipeptide ABC transporter ATP-binding protein
MEETQPALVEIVNLKKHYPLTSSFLDRFAGSAMTIKALNGVSFAIYKGETLGLVGESGCGKSTLGRIILGLEKPSEGFVRFDGRRIDQLKTKSEVKELRKRMQVVFQNPSSTLDPRMTLYQVLSEPFEVHYRLNRNELEKRIREMLELVGLHFGDVFKYSGDFSDGQKQRVALVRALSLSPEFLIADEPVSALDVSVQAQILNLMKRLQAEMHLTMLFISHDLKVVRFLSDRIAVIYLGKIVELGPSQDVFESPFHPYSKVLLSCILDVDPEMNVNQLKVETDVPVSQIHVPEGCVFHLKCPEMREECRAYQPELREVSEGHFSACLRA